MFNSQLRKFLSDKTVRTVGFSAVENSELGIEH